MTTRRPHHRPTPASATETRHTTRHRHSMACRAARTAAATRSTCPRPSASAYPWRTGRRRRAMRVRRIRNTERERRPKRPGGNALIGSRRPGRPSVRAMTAAMPSGPKPDGLGRRPHPRRHAIGTTRPMRAAARRLPCRKGPRPKRERASGSSSPARGSWTTTRAICCGPSRAMPFRIATAARPCACWKGPRSTSWTAWPASPIS